MSFFLNKPAIQYYNVVVERFTATENQTVFTLNNTYETGKNRIKVYVGGMPQYPPTNYTETTSNSITLTEGVLAGTEVVVEITQII